MYFEQLFPNIATHHFILSRKTCPLSFRQRIVYSCVWHTYHGVSLAWIASQTGLNWRTVRDAIKQLIILNLISEKNSKFFYSAPPDPKWFLLTKQGKHGYLHFGKSLSLSIATTVLYSLVCSLKKHRVQTYSGLGKMLGLDARTVRRCLLELSEIKAITIQPYDRVGFDVVVSESVDEIANYFTNKQKTDPDKPDDDLPVAKPYKDKPATEGLTDLFWEKAARNRWTGLLSEDRIRYIGVILPLAIKEDMSALSIFGDMEKTAKLENAKSGLTDNHATLFWHKVGRWLQKKELYSLTEWMKI